ncbi:DUF7475 family protein [Halonotius sp. GCM10025705]|uniref:DUF7475 family protein n=1 Tax=Halonotius sp. GCM10025705 TaxID=3252678 RepID=UPI003612BA89
MSTDTSTLSPELGSLNALAYVGIIAAVVSAVIHLRLGVGFIDSTLGISFILAGLGFFGVVALVLINYRRRTVYAVGVPFTAIQIVLWYVFNFAAGDKAFPADVGTLGAIDKVAQVVLIAVLIVLLRE